MLQTPTEPALGFHPDATKSLEMVLSTGDDLFDQTSEVLCLSDQSCVCCHGFGVTEFDSRGSEDDREVYKKVFALMLLNKSLYSNLLICTLSSCSTVLILLLDAKLLLIL